MTAPVHILRCLGLTIAAMALGNPALAVDEYRLDDGVSESAFGIQGGGPNKSLAWLNHFVVTLGDETITHVNIAFGNFPDNKPMTAYLWIDPNSDGDPDDAFVLSSIGGLTQSGGTQTYIAYDIPDVTLSAGDSFFVGCIIDYSDPAGSLTPSALDTDGTDAGFPYPPNNHSWIAGSTVGAVDPNNLDLAQLPVERVSIAMPSDGNWLVRADAAQAYVCPGTGDCYSANGTPGCNDQSCCTAVCAIDPTCCTIVWDATCASAAGQLCNPPSCSGACPSNAAWVAVAATGPSSRWGHGMTYDSLRQRTILFGGLNSSETWEFDGSNWTQQFPATLPPGRTRPGLAYDEANGIAVMFGGQDSSSHFSDTWLWDGNNWQQVLPASAPSPRASFDMVYDAARQRIVLFGGVDAANVKLGDTWEWDGGNWIQRFPANAPSPRNAHDMAYDSSRNVVVLYGGGDAGGSGGDETWEYDGANWTLAASGSAPGLRNGHKMVFDSVRNVTVLYGGSSFPTNTNIWEWNGASWTTIIDNTPGPRSEHDMAFHAATGQTLLFGGVGGAASTWAYPGQHTTQNYLIVGAPDGVGWSWNITGQNVDVCDPNVPGVPSGQSTLDLAQAFASSINNAGCNSVIASATPTIYPNTVLFDITVLDNAPFDICVGPFGQPTTCCVGVAGACSFNPDMHELVLSGADCDANGIDDAIDLLSGHGIDANGNGILDACEELCVGDLNYDGLINAADLAILLGAWGTGEADLNQDGATDAADLAILLGAWGNCDDAGGSD